MDRISIAIQSANGEGNENLLNSRLPGESGRTNMHGNIHRGLRALILKLKVTNHTRPR